MAAAQTGLNWGELTGSCTVLGPQLTAEPGQAYKYHLRAADAAGNPYYLGTGGTLPPGYYQTAFTTCEDAIAARGRLTNLGLPWGLDLGPDQCWEYAWFVSELPPELVPLVGTGAVVELRGTIGDEFEGRYVATVTGWTALGDCGIVPTVPGTWSGLKATYR